MSSSSQYRNRLRKIQQKLTRERPKRMEITVNARTGETEIRWEGFDGSRFRVKAKRIIDDKTKRLTYNITEVLEYHESRKRKN